MKIAIIGRSQILYDTAKLALESGHIISLIITSKAAPEYTVTEEDFRQLAGQTGARFLNTSQINDEDVIATIGECREIDIGLSVNFVRIISAPVIKQFRLGILNCHGGDLPRYRGNACTAWAIINGERSIANCIHRMEGDSLDSGDIIMREYLPLDINTRIGEVYDWFTARSPKLFMSALLKLEEDASYFLEKQSADPGKALRCYPRLPEDGRIDWSHSAEQIIRVINASSEPYSGAFCYWDNELLRIWRASLYDDGEKYCAIPGQIAGRAEDDSVIVITGAGKVRLLEVEYKGRRYKPNEIMRSIRRRVH